MTENLVKSLTLVSSVKLFNSLTLDSRRQLNTLMRIGCLLQYSIANTETTVCKGLLDSGFDVQSPPWLLDLTNKMLTCAYHPIITSNSLFMSNTMDNGNGIQ